MEEGILLSGNVFRALSKTRMSGEEHRIFNAIVLRTLGRNRTHVWIPGKRFAELTQLSETSISRILRRLIENKIVNRTKEGKMCSYSINTNTDEWVSTERKKYTTNGICNDDL